MVSWAQQSLRLNGISIGSAVCAALTAVTSKLTDGHSGPRNSFYCLGHFKNVYDDDDDDDDVATA